MRTEQQLNEPQAIKDEIERAREDIARSVLELRAGFSQVTDWRTWARRRPVLLAVAALGMGIWLGWRQQRR